MLFFVFLFQTGYAAFSAFLMTTEASLDALNEKLPSPIGMDRFRPNIVIGGTEPYAEVCIICVVI